MTTSNPQRRRLVVISLIAVVVVMTFFLFFVFIVMKMNYKEEQWVEEEQSYFRYVSYDAETEETLSTVVSLPLDLEENEFRLMKQSDGVIELISNLGEEAYQCSGTCYCQTDGEFRRIGNAKVLKSGLVTLISAISSVVAYQLATVDFQDECVDLYSSDCDADSIQSEVSVCRTLVGETSDERKARIKDLEENPWWKTGKEPTNPKTYECRATCKLTKLGKDEEMAEKVCNEHRIQRTFVFDCWDMQRTRPCKKGNCGFARKDFRARYLDDFCYSLTHPIQHLKKGVCEADRRSIECRLIKDTDDAPFEPEEPFEDDWNTEK